VHVSTWAPSRRPSDPTTDRLGQRPESATSLLMPHALLAIAARTRHPGARRLSINDATSNISWRSCSSASRAATSVRSASLRRSAEAASRIDFLIASDQVIPDASSVFRTRWTSSSSRARQGSRRWRELTGCDQLRLPKPQPVRRWMLGPSTGPPSLLALPAILI
jgi:hypothetical protein